MSKILIIDDEKNIRTTLRQSLKQDYEVETAVNGEDGIAKIKENDFELVLLDMKLPGIDGMEVLKEMRELDKQADVIMITGFANVETAVEAMKLGAIDYLRKPFSPEEIRGLVKEVMDRRNLDLAKGEEASDYDEILTFAKSCINKRKFDTGYKYLQRAVSLNTEKPEAFNLMGAILELKGKIKQAQKKYRAALALDPTYEPAQNNLERTTRFDYSKRNIDLGDSEEE